MTQNSSAMKLFLLWLPEFIFCYFVLGSVHGGYCEKGKPWFFHIFIFKTAIIKIIIEEINEDLTLLSI